MLPGAASLAPLSPARGVDHLHQPVESSSMLKSSDLDFVFRYNACLPPAQHCVWDPELSLYNGYIRVDMNLARPINVISGSRPPSTYNIVSETRFVPSFALPLCYYRQLNVRLTTARSTTEH